MTRLRVLLGAALRRHRHTQQRTLREVASSAGISLTYLSEIERGRKEASSEVLAALCDALGVVGSALLREVADRLAQHEAVEAARASTPVGFLPYRDQPAAANGTPNHPPRTTPADARADAPTGDVIRLHRPGDPHRPDPAGVLADLLDGLDPDDPPVGVSDPLDATEPATPPRRLRLTGLRNPHRARVLDFQSYRARNSA